MIDSSQQDPYRVLIEFLKQARKLGNLTQEQLAKRLRRPQSFVSKYERGERRVDAVECYQIAKAVGVDPARFMTNLVTALDELYKLEKRRGKARAPLA